MYRKNPGILTEEFEDGELVAFDSEKDISHILNSSAALIYKMCDNTSKEKIIESYLDYYIDPTQPDEIMRRQIINDAINILDAMCQKGLILQIGGD